MDSEKIGDFFISHASEDKDDFVRELAESLMKNGANVFYDEYSIKLGESISDSINKGITTCKHAILVLSNYFFEKKWTKSELQAIFNKSQSEDYKFFIIYHNISHSEVVAKWPLLADFKAISSGEGMHKIVEALFKAIGKQPAFSYLMVEFDGKRNSKGTGLHIMARFGFTFFGDKRLKKTVYDLGTPNVHNNRVSIYLELNERLCFELIDRNYKKISLSVDVSKWKPHEQHILIGNVDTNSQELYLMIDGVIVSRLGYDGLDLPDYVSDSSRSVFGCSLELQNPTAYIVSSQSIGSSLTQDEASSMTKILHDHIKTIESIPK